MSVSLSTEGMIGGGAGDVTAPVITTISLPSVTSDPLVVHIYDETGLAFYHITCRHADGPRCTVWDPYDSAFIFPFDNTSSTKTGAGTSGSPYVFTIYRLGDSPSRINLNLR